MTSFTSNENKGLLWQLMVESNVFAGIPPNKYAKVKDIFEKEVIFQNRNVSTKSLTQLNKQVLLQVSNELQIFREDNTVKPITSTDISQERRTQFSSNLSVKQQEFSNLINSEKPREINFRDDPDDEIENEVSEELISSMISRREKQLNRALESHDKVGASKWIGLNKESTINTSIPKLNIGSDIKLDGVNTIRLNHKIIDDDKKGKKLNDFLSQLTNADADTDTDNVNFAGDTVSEIKQVYHEIMDRMSRLNILIKRLE